MWRMIREYFTLIKSIFRVARKAKKKEKRYVYYDGDWW
jgi:hypothetical protein